MPIALYCTAEQALSLYLTTGRAQMSMPHATKQPGTAHPRVRVHWYSKVQAVCESCSLAGSLMKLVSLLQPLCFQSHPGPGCYSFSRILPHCLLPKSDTCEQRT